MLIAESTTVSRKAVALVKTLPRMNFLRAWELETVTADHDYRFIVFILQVADRHECGHTHSEKGRASYFYSVSNSIDISAV